MGKIIFGVYTPKMKQHLARTLFLLTLSSGQKYERAGSESHSVATCEKKNKSSACCSKQPQELTIPDGCRGTKQDSLFPVSPTHVLAKERVIFHYMGGKCHHDRTGAPVGWERVENKVKAA